MKKLMYTKTKIIFILFLYLSCNNQFTKKDVHYHREFNIYLSKFSKLQNINIENKNIFLLLDISCMDCLGIENLREIEDYYLNLTNSQKQRLLIIFVGQNNLTRYKSELSKIIQNCNGIRDKNGLAFSYELNFSKALLIKTIDDKFILYDYKYPINLGKIQY